MPIYITTDDVEKRLIGKVKFTDDDTEENKMPRSLLSELIDEAEAEIEFRLSQRYSVPFVTDAGLPFANLPARPTAEQLKTLIKLEAVRRVLQTDFGRGSFASGDEYAKGIQEDIEKRIDRLIATHDDTRARYKYPPLPDLQLAAHNMEADDGFGGRVLVTSAGYGAFASHQINNPSETLFNGTVEDEY